MIGSHISIYGEVQGSGYRSWAKEQSLKLQLITGWTRKASDGSIEMFVQRRKKRKLMILFLLCWDGPNMSFIDEVLVKDANSDDSISHFDIL